MSMRSIRNVLVRDLEAVRQEVLAYPDEQSIWERVPGISNSGGNREALKLMAWRQGGLESELDAAAIVDGELGEIVLPNGYSLVGRVLDSEGRALEGVEIHFTVNLPGAGGGARSGMESAGSTSDPEGRFRIDDRHEGSVVDLTITKSGYARKLLNRVPVPSLEPLEIRLEEASLVRGEVVQEDGRAITKARVQLSMATGFQGADHYLGAANTDSEGRFEIEDIAPGSVRLIASASGFRDSVMGDLEIRKSEDLENLRIVLLPGAEIEGWVTEDDGTPVPEAMVMPELTVRHSSVPPYSPGLRR